MRVKTLPRIDAIYWVLVVSSTTLGETAGDFISQTLGFGYGGGTVVLLGLYACAVLCEVRSKRSHAWLYWTTLTLASIGGTTLADFAARTLGLGYPASTAAAAAALIVTLGVWRAWTRSLDLRSALDRGSESLYWLAILASSTLGTAIGDLLSKDALNLDGLALSDTAFGEWMSARHIPLAGFGLGDGTTALLLVALLVVTAVLATSTRFSRMGCYWAAIIVTHPLGAALGDFLAKDDGLDLGNALSSAILAVVVAAVAAFAWRRSLRRPPDPQAR